MSLFTTTTQEQQLEKPVTTILYMHMMEQLMYQNGCSSTLMVQTALPFGTTLLSIAVLFPVTLLLGSTVASKVYQVLTLPSGLTPA